MNEWIIKDLFLAINDDNILKYSLFFFCFLRSYISMIELYQQQQQ
jgi:hypothetical protein